MNKDLKEFMKNLEIGKEITKYKDSKGNIMYFPTGNLYASCSYLTLTEDEYKQAVFNGTVNKNDYKKIKTTRPVPKNTITKKEEDKNIIVDQEVEAYEIWVVANQIGFMSSFNDKEEAVKFVEDVEEKLNV